MLIFIAVTKLHAFQFISENVKNRLYDKLNKIEKRTRVDKDTILSLAKELQDNDLKNGLMNENVEDKNTAYSLLFSVFG